jgi:transposase-like protein
MGKKRHTSEQIIFMLREAEVALSQGKTVQEVCRGISITEQTYYRWRKEFGGLKVDQAKKLKGLERENARLKLVVAELHLDKAILQEALRGNF